MAKKLFEFQKIALRLALPHSRFLLALDMGLGKTFTSLKWLQYLKHLKKTKNTLTTLIVVDSKNLKKWHHELSDLNFKSIIKVETKAELELFQSFNKRTNEIYIISYQRFVSQFKGDLTFTSDVNLIIDESQVLKSPTTKISKLVLKYTTYYKTVLLLSGDPISKNYQNLYIQMRLLQLFDESFTYNLFLEHFTKYWIHKELHIKIISGYKNVDKLLNILYQKSYFLKTKDAIGLPKQNYFYHRIKTSKSYFEFKKDKALITKEFEILGDSFMGYYHQLRMLSSGMTYTKDDNKKRYFLANNEKLEMLKLLLEQSDFSYSLFYNYNCELHFIKQLLDKLEIKYFEINGHKNELDQALVVGKNERVIVLIQYASGARGIDGLQNILFNQIYFSPTTSGELFKQSLKRIHRIGQESPVNYHFLIADHSIEVNIYKTLKTSQDYTDAIFKQQFMMEKGVRDGAVLRENN